MRDPWRSSAWTKAWFVTLGVVVLGACGPRDATPPAQPPEGEPPGETLPVLSATIPNDLPTATFGQLQIDEFGWQNFVALNWSPDGTEIGKNGDNPTVWETYMTTDDIFDPGTEPVWGQRYVPPACAGKYTSGLKILDQANKADDFFEEAFNSGPLVDTNGKFARFEVLYNQSMVTTVANDELYTLAGQQDFQANGGTILFEEGENADESSTGQGQVGAIMFKAVWRLVSEAEESKFHTSQALLFTPAAFNSTGVDTCEGPVSVGLVGLHLVHKTKRQPNWVWATFEHVENAPDCTTPGDTSACGDNAGTFSFFSANCTDCADCNTAPAPNAGASYYLDQPVQKSQLCRVDSIATNDAHAATLNDLYRAALKQVNQDSVWQYYQMVSTQWFDVPVGESAPQFSDAAPPNLANVAIESYNQSNSSCIDCHGGATDGAGQSSDRVWSLGQEFTTSDGI